MDQEREKYKKVRSNDKGSLNCTTFVSKIPIDTSAKKLRDLFKSCDELYDIILSRKKDRFNNTYGIMKIRTKEEVRLSTMLNRVKNWGVWWKC